MTLAVSRPRWGVCLLACVIGVWVGAVIRSSLATSGDHRIYFEFRREVYLETLRLQAEIEAGREHVISEVLDGGNPAKAVYVLTNLYLHFSRDERGQTYPGVAEEAYEAAVSNPDHAKIIGDQIRELSKIPGTSQERDGLFFVYLAKLRTEETIAEICSFLEDNEVPYEPPSDNSAMWTNRRLAVQALSRMDLPGAPTPPTADGRIEEAALWIDWWEDRTGEGIADGTRGDRRDAQGGRPGDREGGGLDPSADPGHLNWFWLVVTALLAAASVFSVVVGIRGEK